MTIDPLTKVPAPSSVERCLNELRNMILNGQLLPGEKVHQSDLAERLQLSRIPLREALSTLQAEGILTHRRNSGYQVSRFSSKDLAEIYLMRRLLETELLRTASLGEAEADRMQGINDEMRSVDPTTSQDKFEQLNQAFHFMLFNTSPLRLVTEEVSRLWYRSGFYRSMYLHEATTYPLVFSEHEQIIHAVRMQDLDALIRVSDNHRQGTERMIVDRLGRSSLQ